MDSASSPANAAHGPAAQPKLRQQMQAWRGLVLQCGRKPGRKCVHSLRVATLRLQAEVEYWLKSQPDDAPAADAVRRWRRQGRKLRRALGPVRQADVYLAKLARVRGWAGEPANGHPACPKACVSAIRELERAFERKRQEAAGKLTAEIGRRRKRLNRLSRKVEAALGSVAPAAQTGASHKILEQIAEAGSEFRTLDAANLHNFRKRIKQVRYLAEVFARADAEAAHQAAALKRMTGAVGEWHDWQALAAEGAQMDGGGAMAAAAEFLAAQAARSLEQALLLCRRSMARLAKMQTSSPDAALAAAHAPSSGRKPPASAPADSPRAQANRLVRAS